MNKKRISGFIVVISSLFVVMLVLFAGNQLLSKDKGLETVTKNIVDDLGVQSIQVNNEENTISLNLYESEKRKSVMNYLEKSLTDEEYEKYDIKFIGNKILSKPEEVASIKERLVNEYGVRDMTVNHDEKSVFIDLEESKRRADVVNYLKETLSSYDFETYNIEFIYL